MAIRYPKEIHDFIRENVAGTTTRDLVVMVNERFGTEFTESKMKSYKKNHKLKSGTICGFVKGSPTKLFPKHVIDFIHENYKGLVPREMVLILNKKFGTSYTAGQIKNYYHRNKLDSGITRRFEKGHTSHNKGKKGLYIPGSEKGWFKKGNVPVTYLPVGTESTRSDGVWVKVAEPNVWKQKHRLVWEEHNGPIPEGGMVTFLDGDFKNTDITNLALITNEINLDLMRNRLRFEDPELTRSGIVLATMNTVVRKKKKEVRDEAKQRGNGKA